MDRLQRSVGSGRRLDGHFGSFVAGAAAGFFAVVAFLVAAYLTAGLAGSAGAAGAAAFA